MGNLQKIIVLVIVTSFATSCNSDGGIGTVSGTVSVDGKSVDTGTIHFQPVERQNSKGAGGLIEAGKFKLPENEAITAGTYDVVIHAFSKTGRIVKDPQKGDVPETAPIPVADMPKKVTLSSDNYSDLQISFKKATK